MSNYSYNATITIIKFRLKDFISEYQYKVLSPLISTILFVIIFSTIENYYSVKIDQKSFLEFLIPGLILMVVVQESFDNSSSTIVNMKQIGSFDDFLKAPISRIEIFASFIVSSIIIGLFLAFLNYFILTFFFGFEYFQILFFCFYTIVATVFFSSLGCLTGFLSYNWDTQSSVSNFVVIPISLLSGTFFSINDLPNSFKFLLTYNPYYYVVSNFRSSFYFDFEFYLGVNLLILFTALVSIFIVGYVFYRGFKVIK